MGARQEVDAGRDPAEHAAQPAAPAQPQARARVHRARCGRCGRRRRRRARARGPAKSAASKPFVIETTIRVASSGKASTRRRAASGVFMTMAAALASWRRMRRRSTRWCRPVGYSHISSRAHGSWRSAIHGIPSSRESAIAASVVWYGMSEAKIASQSRPASRPTATAPSSHHRSSASGRSSRPPTRRAAPVAGAGSGPGTRCTSARASPASASVGSSGVQRAACPPVPVTTTGVQPRSGRCSAKRRLRCTPPPPTGGKW